MSNLADDLKFLANLPPTPKGDVPADLFREWSVQMVQGIWHAIEVLEEFEERVEEDDGLFTPKEFHDLRYHLLGTITCPKNGTAIPQVMRDMGIDVDADDEDD